MVDVVTTAPLPPANDPPDPTNECLVKLLPGFKILDKLKELDLVCQTLGPVASPGEHDCTQVEINVDYLALCQLVCCCDTHGKSRCTRLILNSLEHSHFKSEESYFDFKGHYRTPDVTVTVRPTIKKYIPTDPPDIWDYLHQIYEIKYTKDRYRSKKGADGKSQYDAYTSGDYFPLNKFHLDEVSPKKCDCKDGKPQPQAILDKATELTKEKKTSLLKRMIEELRNSSPDLVPGMPGGQPWTNPDDPRPYGPRYPNPDPIFIPPPWYYFFE